MEVCPTILQVAYAFLYNQTGFDTHLGIGVSVVSATIGGNYTAECFLDGVKLPTMSDKTTSGEHSHTICTAAGLPDTIIHNISVNVSVPTLSTFSVDVTGFFFDYIAVVPPPSLQIGGYDLLFQFPSIITALQAVRLFHAMPFLLHSYSPSALSAETRMEPHW